MYENMTMTQLADLADARLAGIPGCAALPEIVWAAWPWYRGSEARRERLIAALRADDAAIQQHSD